MTGATIGKLGRILADKPAYINQRVLRFKPKENVDWNFIYYVVNTKDFSGFVYNHIDSETAQPNISAGTLATFSFSIPPLPTQRKIASILSALDDKIETNNAICRNLEEQAMAMYKSWFVNYLHHKSGDFVESDTGLIPKGWHITSMSEYFPIMTGKKNANVSTAQGKYPFFSCSQDIAWTNGFSSEGPAILVAGNGDFNIKRYSGKFEAYQRTYVLIPYNPQLTGFLYYAIAWGLSKITAGARGSVIKFITKGNIADYKVAVPDNLINLPIIAAINSLNAIIDNLKTENLRLTNLRNTLLPKLMSGKLAVENYNLPIKG
jgi:type I restriction enzyme S subunit